MSNLKFIRNKKGITRKELSEKSGINIRTIESYEQKRRKLSNAKMETLIKLSNALKCKIEDLI